MGYVATSILLRIMLLGDDGIIKTGSQSCIRYHVNTTDG